MHGVRQVLSDTDFAFDGLKLVTLSFGDGMAHEQEFSSSALPADVSEPQEPEGWRITLSVALHFLGREASETDESGFLGMELELELLQPLPQMHQEPFRVLLVLKADDGQHHEQFHQGKGARVKPSDGCGNGGFTGRNVSC